MVPCPTRIRLRCLLLRSGQLRSPKCWLRGNAFIYAPRRDDKGYPVAPMFLLPPGVTWDPVARVWKLDGADLDPWQVIHLRGRAPYTLDGLGVGVLTRYAATMGLAGAVSAYAAQTFTSGVPAGYLKVDSPNFPKEKATELREEWLRQHGSRRSIAVLGANTDFRAIQLSPVDAELVGMENFGLRQIAHAFGMSAHMLDVPGAKDTYSNVQDTQRAFRQQTLLPWARLIESTLETFLPRGQSLKLALEGLERADIEGRYRAYQTALAAGWMTVDEVRDLEDLPPLLKGSDNG
jgi:HK97 family phage portal protein